METKICTHCKKELSIKEFGVCRSNKDGLMKYCKPCNKSRPFPIPKRKVCEICNKEKAIKHFTNEKTNKVSRFCHTCLPKHSLFTYYISSRENPEEFKEYHRNYKRKWRAANAKSH